MAGEPEFALQPDGTGRRIGVIASRFNGRIVEKLIEGAVGCLEEHGVDSADIDVVRVPGAWELAQAAEELAALGNKDALLALGVVIRGETPHFDHLCAECARGLGQVAIKYRVPISFGVLTCNSAEQAEERAGGRGGNKGREAAQAALEMAGLFEDLRA